jgi:hypothetical protein
MRNSAILPISGAAMDTDMKLLPGYWRWGEDWRSPRAAAPVNAPTSRVAEKPDGPAPRRGPPAEQPGGTTLGESGD